MTDRSQSPLKDSPSQSPLPRSVLGLRDDVAYLLPMLVFLACVGAGARWPALYPQFYIARALLVPIVLILWWPSYTKIRWNGWWLGLLLGVVGIVQWVGMQLLLQKIGFHYHDAAGALKVYKPFAPPPNVFDPATAFSSPAIMWSWLTIRVACAALVVPVMEELFWRDFLWRTIIAPADFKLAKVGEWDPKAFFGVSLFFCFVHGNWWLTAIVWGLMIAWLLVHTKSLGACIVMHGTTNLLLALYVLHTHDWSFW